MTLSEQARADAMAVEYRSLVDWEKTDFSEQHYSHRFNTLRQCASCKDDTLQSRLIHYSTRRYAHATCLLDNPLHGWQTILALPAYQRDKAVQAIARAAFGAMPGLRGEP